MIKIGLALAREREKQMETRMAVILGWEHEEEVSRALQRLGLIPGEEAFEKALAIWRDQR